MGRARVQKPCTLTISISFLLGRIKKGENCNDSWFIWKWYLVPAEKWTIYLITMCHLIISQHGSELSSIFISTGDFQPSDYLLSKSYTESRLLRISAAVIITSSPCRQQSLSTVNIYCHNETPSQLTILRLALDIQHEITTCRIIIFFSPCRPLLLRVWGLLFLIHETELNYSNAAVQSILCGWAKPYLIMFSSICILFK